MGKDLKGKELGKGITQRRDGTYQARFKDKFGKRKCLYNQTLSTLKKELREAIREDTERPVVKRDYSLDEWYTQWMDVYKYEVRDSSRLQYANVYLKHISTVLGKYSLSQITTLDVRRLLNNMKSDGYSFEMRSKARIILLDMFDKAVTDDFAV